MNKPESEKELFWWQSEFQYLLNRKILSRDELTYLFGQIKSIIDRNHNEQIEKYKKEIEGLKAKVEELEEKICDWKERYETKTIKLILDIFGEDIMKKNTQLQARIDKLPSTSEIAFVLKENNFPFMKCISKERRNEAYFDLASAISKRLGEM